MVVHCLAGLGRTSLSCCLVARGRSPAEAMSTVRATRPASIQTPIQEAFLLELAAAWASQGDAPR